MASAAREEAEAKVAATREMLVGRGSAGPIVLVRWDAVSSGKLTRWHMPAVGVLPVWRSQFLVSDVTVRLGGGPAMPVKGFGVQDVMVSTVCGVQFRVLEGSLVEVVIEPEFGIPDSVLSEVCGTCLLLSVRPVRPGP